MVKTYPNLIFKIIKKNYLLKKKLVQKDLGFIGPDIKINHNFAEKTGTLKNQGEYIDKIRTHGDRAAWFLVSGENISEVEGKIDEIYNKHKRYNKC